MVSAPRSRILIAAFGATMAFLACGSESATSAESGPIVGTWKQTMSEKRIGTADWATADDATCRSDNTEEFTTSGVYTLYDGTIRCGKSGTGIVGGKWRLAAGNSKVVFTFDEFGGEYEQTIEQLTETDMVRTFNTGLTDGTQVRSTFRKQ